MSREVYTLNPYKQVLLREEEYLALAEKANANEEQIKQLAKEMYEQKGTASLGISLHLQEGGCGREYEKIRISNPMLSQTTELGSIPKESIEQINSAVREMLVDFYNEYQRPVDEVRKEYEKKTRWAKFQLNMFGVVIFFGTLCGLLMSIVFRLLK